MTAVEKGAFGHWDSVRHVVSDRQGGKTKAAVEALKRTGGLLLCRDRAQANAIQEAYGGYDT